MDGGGISGEADVNGCEASFVCDVNNFFDRETFWLCKFLQGIFVFRGMNYSTIKDNNIELSKIHPLNLILLLLN